MARGIDCMNKKKRKKYPRLPNGFGCISYLGEGRRNPYVVRPPVTEFKENNKPITPKPLCYTDSWIKGFAILTSYKAGTYKPNQIDPLELPDSPDDIINSIIADYARLTGRTIESGLTFKEIFAKFYTYKYERKGCRNYSNATKNSSRIAFNNCSALHERIFTSLRHDDLQGVIDDSKLGYASLELIVSLFHQIYEFAMAKDYAEKGMDYSNAVKINIEDNDKHGEPFSEDDLKIFWKDKEDKTIAMLLIMIYSGYRITAYKSLEIHLKERYFKGGVKTRTTKEREVPIHSAIIPLVENFIKDGEKLMESRQRFRQQLTSKLKELGIHTHHTPHDTRHTFSMLCEKYEVKENDRKRMLGHVFKDITNKVYGHRELEELRKEIEKIKVED